MTGRVTTIFSIEYNKLITIGKLLLKRGDKMPQECPADTIPYIIKAGDTLYKIALEYDTTVDEILNVNPGIDPYNLIIGSQICVPTLRH